MIVRILGVLAVGALASYFFDPISGRRRRARLRDQLGHARHKVGDYAEGTAKDLRNRLHQRRQPGSQVDVDPSPPQS